METITIEPVEIELIGTAYEAVKGKCLLGWFETPEEAFLEAVDHDCGGRGALAVS